MANSSMVKREEREKCVVICMLRSRNEYGAGEVKKTCCRIAREQEGE